jgi:hypothetical protein
MGGGGGGGGGGGRASVRGLLILPQRFYVQMRFVVDFHAINLINKRVYIVVKQGER